MAQRSLKGCIEGLEKLIEKDIPRGSLIIVSGPPGSLKSSFVLNILSNYLDGRDEVGLFITLEQSSESHIDNMEGLGIKKPGNLEIADFSDLRKKYRGIEEKMDIFRILEEVVGFYRKEKGPAFTCLALDSLNAVFSFGVSGNLRKELYHFFNMLRESGLTTFVVVESLGMSRVQEFTPELFLADGIIELGMIEKQDEVVRYLQIRKMRKTNHAMRKYRVSRGKRGLTVLGSVYG